MATTGTGKWETKRTIDYTVPFLFSVFATFYAWKKKSSWQVILLAFVLGYVVAYAIITQITRRIYDATNKPAPLDAPSDMGGVIDTNYSPTTDTDTIHKQLTSWFTAFDDEFWNRIKQLNDTSLVLIYNDWNNRYYNDSNKTLTAFLRSNANGVLPWLLMDGSQQEILNTIADRLVKNGAN